MDNIFYRKRETNLFDNLVVDIKQLYKEHPIDKKMDAKPFRYSNACISLWCL
jgi:hypothetical protein